MKVIFEVFGCYGNFYVDEGGKLIVYIHENDGTWYHECFQPILAHLDAKMVRLDLFGVYNKDYDYLDDLEEPDEYFEEISPLLKKAIKKYIKKNI